MWERPAVGLGSIVLEPVPSSNPAVVAGRQEKVLSGPGMVLRSPGEVLLWGLSWSVAFSRSLTVTWERSGQERSSGAAVECRQGAQQNCFLHNLSHRNYDSISHIIKLDFRMRQVREC